MYKYFAFVCFCGGLRLLLINKNKKERFNQSFKNAESFLK